MREAIQIIKENGSIEYARDIAKKMLEVGWKDVNDVLPSNKGKENLKELSEYLINRNI